MKITEIEKADLKLLIWHRGFKVAKKIIEDFELSVLKSLKNVNLWNTENLQELNGKQNYLKWIEDVLKILEWKSQTLGAKK